MRKVGKASKPRESLAASLWREDYYYHTGKDQGHYPADDALGLEVSYTPALAKLICLEGADEQTYLKRSVTFSNRWHRGLSASQIQRVVQRVGSAAQAWQERTAQPGRTDAPIMYVSADGTGVPHGQEPELEGRRGKQPDGKAKTRQVYLGCVFTQHRTRRERPSGSRLGNPTYVSVSIQR